MIIRNKFNGYSSDGRRLYPGGGGGPTTSYTQTSNIPEYAQPYVERMMGATEKQIFKYDDKGENITGFQPYRSFKQAQEGLGRSGETVAGFSPMQKQAMDNLQGYQLPGQTGLASDYTNQAILGSVGAGQYDPAMFGNQFRVPAAYRAGQFGVGDVGVGTFTRPGTAEAYMSPYQQAVTDVEKREATRASNILRQQQQAQAVQQGAFGGSRSAIVEAERQRNLGQQLGDIQARGQQSAFTQAQQQFNAENLQAGLQAQLANQQARQQAQQAREQSRQFGYGQGMTAADLRARYGLEGQRATEQSRQFGAELGLRSYDQAMRGAAQLGELGSKQYQQEMGLMGQQMDVGAKQQAYEQARLNQIIQDYATEQQYPFIQLGTLSNMLRGLPMQASTTQMYQAQPSLLQQGIGLAGAGANIYQAMKAEGGEVREMAGGGIASGVDPYKLPGMMKKLSDDQLKKKTNPQDTDPETLGIAQAEKQRRDKVRGMANGGIIAFKDGGTKDMVDQPFPEDKEAPKKAASPVASRPKAAAPKPAADTSPFQTEYKRLAAEPNKALDELKMQQTSFKTEADVGIEGQMERKQKLYDKYGLDPIAMIQNEKAEQQKALEQAKGDAKKAEYLRWAQMWATFGSTPGPVLRAAVMSINNTIPDLIEDQDKARAIQKEINKSIHDLDRAALMEKKGRVDEAYKLDQEAKGNLAKISLDISKLQVHEFETKRTSAAQMASAEMQKQATIQAARERVAAGSSGLAGDRLIEQQRKAIDVEHFRTSKGLYEQRASLEKQLTYQKDPEKQKSIQSKIDIVNQKITQDRNARFVERGLPPPASPLNPQELNQPAEDSSKADTSGWGELRVKG
jgi:hypothetical protein